MVGAGYRVEIPTEYAGLGVWGYLAVKRHYG